MVYWTEWQARTPSPEEKLAGRYYTAAAILARDAYSAKFRGIRDTIAAIATSSPRDTARDPRLAQLQRVLDEYTPMLDLLDRANALAAGDIRFGDELRSPVPDQNLANVNAVRIARLSFLGDTRGAANALFESLKLRNVSSFWPVGVDTSSSLRLLLMFAPPDAEGLAQLQAEYARMAEDKRVENELVESRARLITSVWPGALGPMAVVPRLRGIGGGGPAVVDVVLRPWITRHVTGRIAEYDEALSVARQPWPARLDMAIALTEKFRESSQNRGGPRLGNLSAVNLAASLVSHSAKRAANDVARQRVAVTVLAIERFRRAHADALPMDLGVLVPQYLDAVPIDPFTGSPLKFTRSEQAYKVYSVGINRTDEGGEWSSDVLKRTPSPTTAVVPKDTGIDIRRF